MAVFVINGGKRLVGELNIDSCKNAILPIMAGSILCEGKIVINNCPPYKDVIKMCDILKALGSKIKYTNNVLEIDNTHLEYRFISNELTKDIRASIFTLGPMLARFKKAKIAFPGGCNIGKRGIDIHLNSLQQLGAEIVEEHGYVFCECKNVIPQDVFLDIPSVGATENIMMFTCTQNGKFKIHNCAKEPEIIDLQNFLNKIGANIVGAGTDCITITGTNKLHGVSYTPIPDRIITGTMLIATAITGGDVKLKNCIPSHVGSLIDILRKSGCKISVSKDEIHLKANSKLKGVKQVNTMPYPGFPTDLQSQLTTLSCVCDGVSIIKENIFESRFRYVQELIKMSANIKVINNAAIVNGKKELFGADVYATDLRGGVSLVLAGLVAKGYTTVHDVEYIDRGYYQLEKQLRLLGADITRY